jgi:4-hydroxybenzoate polyprenyltransferase
VGLTYAAKQEGLNRIGHLWPLLMLALPLILAVPAEALSVKLALVLLLAADSVAILFLVRRPAPGAISRAVSLLIAAICLVDAVAVAAAGGGPVLVLTCVAGFLLTLRVQASIPGT